MSKRLFVTTIIVVLCMTVYAQNKGTVKGLLKDSSSKQILSLATVTVFSAKDTSIITYRLSDPEGVFQVPGVPFNLSCRVVISFQGYKTYRKEFTLTKENSPLDLGTVFMISNPHMMEDVVIIAERPPVVMRNDTLEFNANAFKTLPSAVVEDLLKKLPGVDVDLDGNITVKGKKVNRLLVDGKEFFGGDHKIATRNLPANIVDKIQVTDDQEELESNPQMTKDEVGQVINIKLKKAIRQGWFGKAYAGGGTDERHEAGAIVNIFRDTTQISVLGYSNNVNKPGFDIQDLQNIGGFNRSGTNSTSYYGGGGFQINGTSFGATGQGIQQSRGGGFNFNNQFGKQLTLSLQYFYGQISSNSGQLSDWQRFFVDTVIRTASENKNTSLNKSHRVSGSIIWKVDSLTQLIYRPNLSFTKSNSNGINSSETADNYKGSINANKGNTRGDGNGYSLSQTLSISRRFKKKGRLLNISTDLSARNNDNDYFSDIIYTFYTNNTGKDSTVNQLRGNGSGNFRSNININFTEPLSKNTSLILTDQISYLNEDNSLNYFYWDPATGGYSVFNDIFSTGVEKAGWKNSLSPTLSFRIKKLTIRPGAVFYWADLKNSYTKNPDVKQNFYYVYPSLSVNWKSFNLGYRVSVNEPSASDLQEVIDISNPLYKSYGNPTLKPLQNHNINFSYYKYSQKGHSINISFNMNFNRNYVLRQTNLDSRRIEESKIVNVNGVKSGYAYLFYNKEYKFNKNFRVSVSPSAVVNLNQSFVSFNDVISKVQAFWSSGSIRAFFNYRDKIEWSQAYSVNMNRTHYEDKSKYKDVDYVTRSSQSQLVLRWPKHFVWENLVSYTYNPRVAQGIRKTVVQWNAGASFLFLKQDKGQIKFSAFDVLNQNINVFSYTYDNTTASGQSLTLHRYYMISFIYNIRNFSGGKVGGKDRTFGFF